jgi:hypothetical protein
MEKNFENDQVIINSSFKKNFYLKFKNIVLTASDGYDLPLLQYTQLGLGNLILTYLYALYLKSKINNLEIIPFYPVRIIPIIKDLKYWYLRSSFEFNYNTKHIKRLFYIFLLGRRFRNSFFKKKDIFLNTSILNKDPLSFKKISSLNLNYIKRNITSFLNFNYEIKKKNKLDLIYNKKKSITLGLHLRRGDFLLNKSPSKNFNSSPDINSQIKLIKKIKSKIKVINIYSDQSKSKTYEELGNKLSDYKLKLFPVNSNGSKVLQDMIKNDVIILSNSTLSVISCILSNQLALFNNQILPNKLKKYFKNIKEIKC